MACVGGGSVCPAAGVLALMTAVLSRRTRQSRAAAVRLHLIRGSPFFDDRGRKEGKIGEKLRENRRKTKGGGILPVLLYYTIVHYIKIYVEGVVFSKISSQNVHQRA